MYTKYQAYALWPKIFFKYKEIIVVVENISVDEDRYETQKYLPWLSASSMELNPAIRSCTIKPQ
jgi:hypothetical protein